MKLGRLSLAMLLACPMSGAARADQPADQHQVCSDSYVRAQELRLESRLVEAREQLVRCARTVCDDHLKVDCLAWLSEVERALPTVVFDVRDAQGKPASLAQVSVKGQTLAADGKPVALDPGSHGVTVTLGERTQTQQIVVLAGQKTQRFAFDFAVGPKLPPKPESPPEEGTLAAIHPATWVFAGATLVSLGVLAFAGISALDQESTLKDECRRTRACGEDDFERVYTYRTVADVSGGLAGGFAIASVIALAVSLANRDAGSALRADGISIRF